MKRTCHIIYVPGLNDTSAFNKLLISFVPKVLNKYGFIVHIIYPHWSEGKEFTPKLQQIIQQIDSLAEKNSEIVLIGQSAGGSAVLNAFVERKEKVSKVISICGRLRTGKNVFPSLRIAAKGNPAFKESILLFELHNEAKLTKKDQEKICIIKPLFDEIVPISLTTLPGATNITMPIIGHALGGMFAFTIYLKKIIAFINNNMDIP